MWCRRGYAIIGRHVLCHADARPFPPAYASLRGDLGGDANQGEQVHRGGQLVHQAHGLDADSHYPLDEADDVCGVVGALRWVAPCPAVCRGVLRTAVEVSRPWRDDAMLPLRLSVVKSQTVQHHLLVAGQC